MPLESGDEHALNLVELIVEICPDIVFSGDLADQAGHFIRRVGIRYPSQRGTLLRELEEKRKLISFKKSQTSRLTQKQSKLLKGRGHKEVKDDRPLLEAAMSKKASIITMDPWVQKKHAEWYKEVGVGVYSPDDVHG